MFLPALNLQKAFSQLSPAAAKHHIATVAANSIWAAWQQCALPLVNAMACCSQCIDNFAQKQKNHPQQKQKPHTD